MHEMTLGSENLDRIRSRRAKERSGLAQITFLRSYPLSRPVLCVSFSLSTIKSLRGFSPFFRLPPWHRLAKRSVVVLVFMADVDPPITGRVSPFCMYISTFPSSTFSRAFISVHLSAYHCGRHVYTYNTNTHAGGPQAFRSVIRPDVLDSGHSFSPGNNESDN